MGSLNWPEILLILIVVLLLFGAKKLPDTARSLGRSLRIFKSEVRADREESRGADAQPRELPPGAGAVHPPGATGAGAVHPPGPVDGNGSPPRREPFTGP